MATAESLNQEIAQQTILFNKLRLQNGDPSAVEEAKKTLGELKQSLGALKKAAGAGTKKKDRMLLKTAKASTLMSSYRQSALKGNPITGYKRLWPWGDVLPRTCRTNS
jgi:hypothetical protein